MQRVLLIIDKPGWSYDTIAKGLLRFNTNARLVFDIVAINEGIDYIKRNHTNYDLVFAMGWTLIFSKKSKENYRELLTFLDRSRLITGIHSHRSWDQYSSLPEKCPSPPKELVNKLSQLRQINIISRRLYRIFRDAGLENITLTENGVDTELFRSTHPVNTDRQIPLIVGFSGSTYIPKHDYLKGLSEFILPLNDIPNVVVKVLGGKGELQVERKDMPGLYNQTDLYICASTSEGFSQSVLEASSCGRGIISTRVGGCEDLLEEHKNGFFIRRDLEGIKTIVRRLEADRHLVKKLGENNRKIILRRYSWKIRVQDWLNFVESNLLPNPAKNDGLYAGYSSPPSESASAKFGICCADNSIDDSPGKTVIIDAKRNTETTA